MAVDVVDDAVADAIADAIADAVVVVVVVVVVSVVVVASASANKNLSSSTSQSQLSGGSPWGTETASSGVKFSCITAVRFRFRMPGNRPGRVVEWVMASEN